MIGARLKLSGIESAEMFHEEVARLKSLPHAPSGISHDIIRLDAKSAAELRAGMHTVDKVCNSVSFQARMPLRDVPRLLPNSPTAEEFCHQSLSKLIGRLPIERNSGNTLVRTEPNTLMRFAAARLFSMSLLQQEPRFIVPISAIRINDWMNIHPGTTRMLFSSSWNFDVDVILSVYVPDRSGLIDIPQHIATLAPWKPKDSMELMFYDDLEIDLFQFTHQPAARHGYISQSRWGHCFYRSVDARHQIDSDTPVFIEWKHDILFVNQIALLQEVNGMWRALPK